jgi:hypothetical protein
MELLSADDCAPIDENNFAKKELHETNKQANKET